MSGHSEHLPKYISKSDEVFAEHECDILSLRPVVPAATNCGTVQVRDERTAATRTGISGMSSSELPLNITIPRLFLDTSIATCDAWKSSQSRRSLPTNSIVVGLRI